MSPHPPPPTSPRVPLAALLLPLLPLPLAPRALAQAEPDDARMRQAWGYLTEEEQQDVASWVRAEAAQMDTFQGRILRFMLASEESDPGFFPESGPAEYFDPEKFAPRQPIARRRLKPDDRAALALREQLSARAAVSAFPSAWSYDWGRREVLRTADFQSAQHVFEGALAGCAPGVDFARALVLRALDDGKQQELLAAFGHAYTDRAGNVYPGVTLYDAWSSGLEIEMPDVDVLGLLATITGKTPRWKAPVPDTQHDELYETVGKHFSEARAYRGLRAALAETYFMGSAGLPDSYAPHLMRMHGLWEEHESDPAKLFVELKRERDPGDFMVKWARRFDKDSRRNTAANTRRSTLDWDARQLRALLVRIFEEYGAFERTARPAPKPVPKPPAEKKPGEAGN